MADKTFAGVSLEVTEDGYLVDGSKWTREIAIDMAKEDGKDMTDEHFAVLEYLRSTQAAGETLTIRKVGKSGIVDIKGLYKLFPGGPLKFSSKYAGIPKPTSCV